MEKKAVQINKKDEMDARAMAQAVQLASGYESSLHILFQNISVNLKSIMGVMTLRLSQGDEITLVADGKDEADAIRGLQAFFSGNQA